MDPVSDPTALSYGCTCPGGNDHDPANTTCRYGQTAAVKVERTTNPTGAPVSPPDLTHAIQAAANALVLASAAGSFPVNNRQVDSHTVARVAVKAAWAALVDAHDHQAHLLRVELADLQRRLDQADRNTFEALGQVAELRDLLEQSIGGRADCWRCDMPGGYHLVDCPVAAVLQIEGADDA